MRFKIAGLPIQIAEHGTGKNVRQLLLLNVLLAGDCDRFPT
jgi:hypothetical protein